VIPLRWLAVATLAGLGGAACAEAPVQPAVVRAPECAPPGKAAEAERRGDGVAAIALDQAASAYEDAARLDPKNHRVLFKLAEVRRKQEQWEAAEAALTKAVELAPTFATYWLELGRAREKAARAKRAPWAAAREPLERCVALDPNLAECHVELGTVLLWLDDEPGALASYTRAVEKNPTNVAHYTLLAGLYIDLGRTDDAAAVLAAAPPSADPPRPDRARYNLHLLRARVLYDRGDIEKAVGEIEAARQVVPDGGPEATLILWNLGSAYATMKPPRKAEALANLEAFSARACRGAHAASYRTECEQVRALIAHLSSASPP
jgi:tetratricopeptide (TPR) repeat protein